ncbi:Hypothetical predicted protein, partial [Pelobates cultripes]
NDGQTISPPRKRKEKANPCSGCEGKAVEGKQLCLLCIQKLAAATSPTPVQ